MGLAASDFNRSQVEFPAWRTIPPLARERPNATRGNAHHPDHRLLQRHRLRQLPWPAESGYCVFASSRTAPSSGFGALSLLGLPTWLVSLPWRGWPDTLHLELADNGFRAHIDREHSSHREQYHAVERCLLRERPVQPFALPPGGIQEAWSMP